MKTGILERIFHLRERGTSVRTELLAGTTTFITLAYIIFVNPGILSDAGIPKEAAIAATIYAAALATLLMGLWANLPVAVAPGMGLNAFFAYYVVGKLHLPWQVGLGAVFFSGLLFLLLTITKARQAIIRAVPDNLKAAIGVGIGLFIAFIGLKNAGIVVADKSTFVTTGNLTDPSVLLAIIGLLVTALLMARGVKGAILIGIIFTTLLGMVTGQVSLPAKISDIISLKIPSLAPTFMKLDIAGAWEFGLLNIIFTFTMVELFDNIGTLIGVTRKAGLMDEEGNVENLGRALTVDAFGTIISAVFGTTTVTSYIESAAGVAEGGKTGLTAVTVGILFLVALFFAPLIALVPVFATAPALIIVGVLMFTEIRHIKLDDFTEVFPAFMTIIMMPLTFSIASGFAFGFVSYVLVKLLAGRAREVSPIMWIVSAAFIVNFYLRLH